MTDPVERELRRSFMRTAYRRSNEQVSPISHVVGFWFCLTAAVALFAASVFLPMWQERQEVLAAKARTIRRLDALRGELTRLQAIVSALGEDPVLNEHVALRELNFHLPGQEIITVRPEEAVATPSNASGQPARGHRSRWLSYLPENWLRLETWVELVSQRDVRRGMLLAAAFLASAGFVLFAPPAPRPLRLRVASPSPKHPGQDPTDPA